MTYVPDDVVDAVIARNQTLQEVVQGQRLMLWRPGTTATVIAQGCLMFGGIGLIGSVLWFWPPSIATFKYGFFFGLLLLAAVTGGVFHGVVRDWASEQGWDKSPPAPELPADVIEQTRGKYVEAFERVTETSF